MQGTPVLSISNLVCSFGHGSRQKDVVKGLSFDLGARETLALVGESGSGKSVTSLATMRLLPPVTSNVHGSIRLDGRELLELPEAEMRRIRGNDIAMIFQEPMTSLNPLLTIGYQIAEALTLHSDLTHAEAKAQTLRLLDRVGIPAAKSRFDEYPHLFSGGMRQRAMIAMALACKPRLLIADEPTTALDVTIQAQILELIREVQCQEGMSVLFITHDMGVVAEIADRAVVMCAGEQIEDGTTDEIFRAPRQPYTKSLLAAVPKLGSMEGEAQPRRFPLVDRATGTATNAPVSFNTVAQDRPPLLQVTGLTKRFDMRKGWFRRTIGSIHAVENVSFDLRAGETLAVVGESGCGKSTTGRAVMQLIQPSSGSVCLDGNELTNLKGRQLRLARRSIQMIFQDPYASLNPRMRVGTAIAEPMIINGITSRSQTRKRVSELLSLVGLTPDMADRYPHEFSGGQRQRICIARALGVEPQIIVADESVSALDVSVKAQVINLMMDLQERLGISYLFISHDMAVVERVSHRIAVMYMGEIVEIGPRASVFGNPQHSYTKRLLSAVPIADPGKRSTRRAIPSLELRSQMWKPGEAHPSLSMKAVGNDHFVAHETI